MTIAESRRLALFESIKTFLGEDNARTLMDYLPPDPDTVATKADLAILGSDLRVEMAELRGELRGEMAELRGELRGEMAELRGEMSGLRVELQGEMALLGSELRREMGSIRSDLSAQIARETRSLALAMIGMVLTVLTIALGAVALA